jgi:hypothetical protein
MELPTSERLANALDQAGAPPRLVNNARIGLYDLYKSPYTFPKMALLSDLRHFQMNNFCTRVLLGEFEPSSTEVLAWLKSTRNA